MKFMASALVLIFLLLFAAFQSATYAAMIFTGVPLALTGGVFSRSPEHLEKARKDFRVGNLYLNRNNTGALVERQPFGGFKMSGVGSKTGGPDYLLQFMGQRVMQDLRVELFAHVQRLSTSFFDRTPTGSLVTRLTSDVEVLGEMFAAGIISAMVVLLRRRSLKVRFGDARWGFFYSRLKANLHQLSMMPIHPKSWAGRQPLLSWKA